MSGEDDKKLEPLVNALGERVGKVEVKVTALEVAHGEDRQRFKDGAEHMARTDRRVEGVETGMKDLARDVAADNRASNQVALTEIDKLRPRPWPWWLRGVAGLLLTLLGTFLAAGTGMVIQQQIRQAETSKDIQAIQDSAARQEAVLRELDKAIRGVTPGKGP